MGLLSRACEIDTHMSDSNETGHPEDRLILGVGQSSSLTEPQQNVSATNDVHRCNCTTERCTPESSILTTNYTTINWHDDDPPPYSSLVNDTHRVAWSYVFPNPPYEDSGGNGSDNRTIARPLVSIPLTSYGIYKIEPPRYAAVTTNPLQRQPLRVMISEPGPAVKSFSGTTRKYGAILIAATVILFLMALSLLVRFVVDKSLWRKA